MTAPDASLAARLERIATSLRYWNNEADAADVRAAADALGLAEAERDRYKQERYELLGVQTTEGLGAAEWMSRTAHAEAIASAARVLANFGLAVLGEMRVDLWGDIDGGWAQDAAEKCGVIEPHEVTEPCRPEGCRCAEYGFPCTCYRDSEAVKAYRASVEGKA